MTEEVPTVPVTMVINSYFEELTESTRTRPMPWEGYQRAGLITEDELALLRQSGKDKEASSEYINLLVTLLNKLVRVDTLQYILVLIDDILEKDPSSAQTLHEMSEVNPNFPYEPFIKCLKKDEEFLALKAEKIITFLICTSQSSELPEAMSELLESMIGQLSSRSNNVTDVTVQLFQSLLRNPDCRLPIYHKSGALTNLISLIGKEKTTNPQMVYQIAFCFWLLSYEVEIAENIDHQHDIISLLIEMAKLTGKEKIIRVVVGAFKNLLEKAPESNISSMLVNKLFHLIDSLIGRKWNDDEIKEDLEYLKSSLESVVTGLTTFEAYKNELESGQLEWSPVHKSIQFWKTNSIKLEEEDNKLLLRLVEILRDSDSNLVRCVACNDVGMYVKFSPNGKRNVDRVGAKQLVMELMVGSDSDDVKYQALIAVQNCLMHTWDKK